MLQRIHCPGIHVLRLYHRLCPQAERPKSFLKVYHCYYAASLERDAFIAGVEREASVFAELIRAKQHLVLPLDMDAGGQVRAGPAVDKLLVRCRINAGETCRPCSNQAMRVGFGTCALLQALNSMC